MLIDTHTNIAEVTADIIVNAANAVGYMGGWLGKHVRLRGVAESIHYATKGAVEKEARMIVQRDRPGLGEVYVTGAYNLPAHWIVHAVTMMKPGSRSNIEAVGRCVDNIIGISHVLGAKTVAIPLLGTGVGGVEKAQVEAVFREKLGSIADLDIIVVTYR